MRSMRKRKNHRLKDRTAPFHLETLERRLLLNGSLDCLQHGDLSDFIKTGYEDPHPFYADPAGGFD